MKIINQNGWKRFHERKGVKRTQKQQVSIPVSKKKKKAKLEAGSQVKKPMQLNHTIQTGKY